MLSVPHAESLMLSFTYAECPIKALYVEFIKLNDIMLSVVAPLSELKLSRPISCQHMGHSAYGTLSIWDTQHNNTAIMLSAIMLSNVMLEEELWISLL
jgi:hypothetical protein